MPVQGFYYEADYFVLDEPSLNKDAASIMDLRRIIAHWKEQEKRCYYIGHRLYYLRGLADQFIYMKEGQIIQDYSATEFEKSGKKEKREEMGLGLCSGKSPYARDC